MTLPRRALLPLLLLPATARAEAFDAASLMTRLARVAERRATFREERALGALTAPLVSTGRLLYRRPDYLEKNTLWPRPEQMVIDGNRLIINDPASNDPPHVVDLTSQPELRAMTEAMRAPLAGDLAALRRAFTPALTGDWAEWTLTLTPTGPAARLISSIGLTGQDDWLGSIRVSQTNGDASLMQIDPA